MDPVHGLIDGRCLNGGDLGWPSLLRMISSPLARSPAAPSGTRVPPSPAPLRIVAARFPEVDELRPNFRQRRSHSASDRFRVELRHENLPRGSELLTQVCAMGP
jgi:hypothetical protein